MLERSADKMAEDRRSGTKDTKKTGLTGKLFNDKRVNIILFLLFPAAAFFINQYAMTDDLDKLIPCLAFLDIIFLELFSLLLFSVTGSLKKAARITVFLSFLTGVINAYVYRFRGTYMRPWDLFSVKTALNVADNFDYAPDGRMIVAGAASLVLIFAAGLLKGRKDGIKPALPVRAVTALSSLILIILMAFSVQNDALKERLGVYTTQFDSKGMIRKNGMAVTFMYQMKYLTVDKPSGYSASAVKESLDALSAGKTAPENMPDILVFMDEAFSDPAADMDFETTEDYMPFMHQLQEGADNTVTGYVNVSVNGGNTPNSEFEFLTGSTMGFLPEGSIAFQQYLWRNTDSLATFLKSFGYRTFASHPYKKSGWDRTRVWPLLGFEETFFDDHFMQFDPPLVRNYVSDRADFSLVGEKAEEYGRESPVFSFNVTMQNHSAYSREEYENFTRKDFVPSSGDDRAAVELNNYLTLIKYTDDALKELIEKYSSSDRDTMIVFFGDHQPDPSVLRLLWDEKGEDYEHLKDEDYVNSYRVPFLIWANFDIEEEKGLEISLNYLGNLALKKAGFSLPPYRQFLEGFREDYPVVSAVRYVDKDKRSVLRSGWGDELSEYQKMEYYELFDDKDGYE